MTRLHAVPAAALLAATIFPAHAAQFDQIIADDIAAFTKLARAGNIKAD